jgi:hypothetical protein
VSRTNGGGGRFAGSVNWGIEPQVSTQRPSRGFGVICPYVGGAANADADVGRMLATRAASWTSLKATMLTRGNGNLLTDGKGTYIFVASVSFL